MFSMCVVLLVFFSISTVVVSSKTVTGHRGERVDIRCSYDAGYESNSKYFCKGKCNYRNKIIMVKSGSPAKDKRFSLTDNKRTRVFTVSITDLRTEDTGLYWCAVKRPFTDIYSEILLIVKQTLFQQNVQHNTESVHMYEIANSDPGPSDVIASTSSPNQMPASHLNTRPQVSAVYATVTNQQPDSKPSRIHSANQVTICDYYANMNSPEPTTDCRTELIYATATHPQNVKTNDGLIYSVIKHK
uniref:CMRF35-like molecule 1 n=1 Tax=Sinocyclocheilus anshuiensis TaxID=1608454 RepID=A0A671MCP9_9TELE